MARLRFRGRPQLATAALVAVGALVGAACADSGRDGGTGGGGARGGGGASGGGGGEAEILVAPPPADVAALVDGVLTEEGKRLLYRGDPKVLDKAEFDVVCPIDHELTVILGCYNDGRIGILRVDRPDLAPVMVVTAAHEMLHVAYAALSRREREQVDGWLEAFYGTVDDPEIRELITQYEQQGRDVRLNELHSILPTELFVLSPDLETYYGRYFADRHRVVAAHESYAAVFRDIKRRVASLHGEIDRYELQLTSLDVRIAATRRELEAMNARLDQLRAQRSMAAFNSLVPEQNALVDRYNGLVDQYNRTVDVHNQKVDEVNALALEQDELATSLGSKPTATPAS